MRLLTIILFLMVLLVHFGCSDSDKAASFITEKINSFRLESGKYKEKYRGLSSEQTVRNFYDYWGEANLMGMIASTKRGSKPYEALMKLGSIHKQEDRIRILDKNVTGNNAKFLVHQGGLLSLKMKVDLAKDNHLWEIVDILGENGKSLF